MTQSCAVTKNPNTENHNWLDELFLRFTAIYRGKWTYSLQDERMLELTRYEWLEALKGFDEKIIQETVTDVKKIYKDVPSISEFYEIAKAKEKARAAHREFEEREIAKRKELQLEQKRDPAKTEAARQALRDLCKKLSVGGRGLRKDDGRYTDSDVR